MYLRNVGHFPLNVLKAAYVSFFYGYYSEYQGLMAFPDVGFRPSSKVPNSRE